MRSFGGPSVFGLKHGGGNVLDYASGDGLTLICKIAVQDRPCWRAVHARKVRLLSAGGSPIYNIIPGQITNWHARRHGDAKLYTNISGGILNLAALWTCF